MKNKKLEKIAKEVAHPFLSLFPNQEYFNKKLEWYKPYKGILESSSLEILFPLISVATNPSLTGLAVGGAFILDGMWRINNLLIENSSKRYSGTNFLEIPYNAYKKIK